MKKILLLSALFLLFLISCAPVNQEELKVQAAAELQNLSDDELQQMAEQDAEGKALAGQVYRINPVNTALRRLSTTDRNAVVAAEQARRQLGRPDDPCSTDTECQTNLRCRYDSITRRNNCQWWNVGATCTQDSDCSTQLCGIAEVGSRNCEEGNNPLNYRCRSDRECATGLICGLNSVSIAESYPPQCGGGFTCETPNSGISGGDFCQYNRECASRNCRLSAEFCNLYGRCA